ncbi:hypothetical protein PGTUg99_030681 [Puccinia graminis f. sp. tritici]|uniref:F-box domain-containing protein n=1 Tax=Puccinia graminis f. sp. tritici TaxID=56615 RepID=A0A5B0SME8_PUCGR|nr:hypothetical protein PGTUg99_030681 [Puccinia graminis f. sp. tritici]
MDGKRPQQKLAQTVIGDGFPYVLADNMARNTYNTSSLSQLPTEIKLLVIKYVALQTKKDRRGRGVDEIATPWLNLAFVNRSFYELCSAINWKLISVLHKEGARLDQLIDEILPRQAQHVRALVLGLDTVAGRNTETLDTLTGTLPRVKLINILNLCTSLAGLQIHLDTYEGKFDAMSTPLPNPIPTSIHPVAQLSNLTYFYLDDNTPGTGEEGCFREEYLINLIRNMIHLVHFRIKGHSASSPTCNLYQHGNHIQPVLSPLAVHLASLNSLKIIDLTLSSCFNSSWNKINWKGALEGIVLHRIPQLSFGILHDFCTLFKESLVSLSLCDCPISIDGNGEYTSLDESEKNYVFYLPKLEKLSVFTPYSTEFIYLFRECYNITKINLVANRQIQPSDIKRLIDHDDPVWTHLKSLVVQVVQVDKGEYRPKKIADLVAYGSKVGIKVECGHHSRHLNRLFMDYQMRIRDNRLWRPVQSSESESEE